MESKPFAAYAATPAHPDYRTLTKRSCGALYEHDTETRSPFMRDYTRILHSTAYRRLKHKTQVFFNTEDDHICTRIEHVSHVESVSGSLAEALGLNTELTRAIATGHDLGHAPFGHEGEKILRELSRAHLGEDFWHEQNGVYLADRLELLEDDRRILRNLNLTYAVRDGIISHCGEVDENGLRPRDIAIRPEDFTRAGQYQPATFEGCVVKLADKIAYLGRDIEDALLLGLFSRHEKRELEALATRHGFAAINTTVLMHGMINDLLEHSTPEKGLLLSEPYRALMDDVKRFNTDHIYSHPRLAPFCRYAHLVLCELFAALAAHYRGAETPRHLARAIDRGQTPLLLRGFLSFLSRYVTCPVPQAILTREDAERYQNDKVYGDLGTERQYLLAVRDYLAGMSDGYAVRMFGELLSLISR
ncbi:MAG: HD domain-containing protein [Ruminococcaceae bacterium]|nr:HD domain-containing protein [Oscillospiraceae bacterium]